MNNKLTLLFVTLIAIIGLYSFPPIAQDPTYHHFADQRTLFHVAHFFDVFSNSLFIIFGIMGLSFCRSNIFSMRGEKIVWITLFLGSILVGLGSGYYHLNPNNKTLVWDRLPMTIVFMSFFSLILMERLKASVVIFPLLLIVGIVSVFYWQAVGDLRLYALVQFLPLLLIPLLLWLFPARYDGIRYLAYAFCWYLLAKVCEHFDRAIFTFTDHFLSGHTLKHLTASMAIYSLLLWVKKRTPLQK